VHLFESEAVSLLARLAGCETVVELPGGLRPRLDLSSAPGARLLDRFTGDAGGPGGPCPDCGPLADLSVSRRFGTPGEPPSPGEAKEEMARLFSLTGRLALALYPAKARPTLGEIASGLWHPLTLEGFMPHRYPVTFHDRGEAGAGDIYVFALEGEAVPAPFRAAGGRFSRRPHRPLAKGGGPDDPERLLSAVKELVSRRRAGEAVPLLSRLIGMRPGEPRLRLNLGYLHLSTGSHDEAAEAFRSVLAEDPDNGEARRALAGIHLSRSEWSSLRAFLPELLILKATSPKVLESWPSIRKAFLELETGA
jgi:tetratricopeptide (TPR) repeat protein